MGTSLSGRRAEAERNDKVVLNAAREVFAEQGFDAPISAVARRAGVGMGSLYRRYRSKEELVQRLCVINLEDTTRIAREALAEEPDGWSALTRFMQVAIELVTGKLAHLAGTFPVTDELWDKAAQGRVAIQAILDRAHEEGSLRPDVNVADINLFFELVRSAKLADDPQRAAELRHRYVAVLLDGLRAPARTPLPGPPPSWRDIEKRWAGDHGPRPGAD